MHSLGAYTKSIIHSEILERQGHMDGDAMSVPKFQTGQPFNCTHTCALCLQSELSFQNMNSFHHKNHRI